MKDAQMIDEKTKNVKIDLLMYNPSFGHFTKVTVTFEFDLGGTINLDIQVENFNANLYEDTADELRFILEIVFMVLVSLQCMAAVNWDRGAVWVRARVSVSVSVSVRVRVWVWFGISVASTF